MSKKSKAIAQFCGKAKRTGYSHRTRRTRMNIARRFVEDAHWILATPVDGPGDVTPALLQRWVAHLVTINKPRTIQNKLSAVRRILEVSGHEVLAASSDMRSRALGAPRGSRDGTNAAIEDDQYERLLRLAAKEDEPGLVVTLKLQRAIGLRRQEAIMCVRTLEEWEQLLQEGMPLPIRHGAKNGRPRNVTVPDPVAALQAVREARAIAETLGGVLIRGETLQVALTRYSFLMCKRIGYKGHALRYAFARDRYVHYRNAGLTEDEAWPLVSDSLGHGLNREDLMRCVYLKGVIPRKSR